MVMSIVVRDASDQPVLPLSYESHDLMARAVFALKWSAGRGLTQFGDPPQEDGTSLAGFAVQLGAKKWRVLVFRGQGGRYTLVDDFIASASNIDEELAGARLQSGSLVYTGYSNQELLVRPLAE
jgi:hypothetical protein